jgi:hypothetical protein
MVVVAFEEDESEGVIPKSKTVLHSIIVINAEAALVHFACLLIFFQ